jgi:hypothetical protein
MSLPRWVILLMLIPSLIVLAAIWLWVSRSSRSTYAC